MSVSLVISGARLLDPCSGLDQVGDLRVEGGKIVEMGDVSLSGAEVLDAGGDLLLPGLIDLCVRTGEPGAEHRENLASAGEAAARGGVTTMLVMPDTDPVIDNAALVDFVLRRGRDTSCVRVYPAAALTRGLSGRRMSELGLLHESGALAFSDGGYSIEDSGVLARVLRYAANFSVPVFLRPDTPAMSLGGDMTQCEFADSLGLRGVSASAEWIGLERDLILASESGGVRLIVDRLSTGRSLERVVEARGRGIDVGCTVSAAHIFFNALDVGDYLTHAKLSPPLRKEEDRQALVAGLSEIDAVVSGHDPQPAENKRLPFSQASFGAVGLETLLASMLSLVHGGFVDLRQALVPLTCGPAGLLGLESGYLRIGAPADLILVDMEAPWVCREEGLISRSRNSPWDGRRLQGLVKRTIVGGKTVFARESGSGAW